MKNETPKIKSVVVKTRETKNKNIWCTRTPTRQSSRKITIVKDKPKADNAFDQDSALLPCEGSSQKLDLSDNQELDPCEGSIQPVTQNLGVGEASDTAMAEKRSASPLNGESKRSKPNDGASTSLDDNPGNLTESIQAMFESMMQRIDGLEKRFDDKKTDQHNVSDEECPDYRHENDQHSEMFDLGVDNVEEGQITDQDEGDFSALLMKGVEDEKKGRPLEKDAMVIVKGFFDKAPEAAVFKPLRELHNEPENCENLSAKDVNSEVFRCMKETDKNLDFMVKSIQSNVAASAVANLRMIDEITAMCRSGSLDRQVAKQLLDLCCDASKLGSRSYCDLSQLRKFLLRDLLAPKYRSLCFTKTFGNQLFGEDISKSVKAIDDETKIMKDFKKSAPGKRFESRIPTPAFQPKNWETRGRDNFRSHFRGYRRRQSRGRGVSHQQPSQKKPHQN